MTDGDNSDLEQETGTVKWFNSEKGFGFIARDGGGLDAFVVHSAIDASDFRTLGEGQRVSFFVTAGPTGPQAERVRSATSSGTTHRRTPLTDLH